ncbi:MAG: LysR family transcriptional regulator [Polyangiales bacterium]
MDITQVEAFLAIAKLGSFSKAAARLHRSQPAISRRIALLEGEVGAPLFERIRKHVQLTDAGRALRPHAEAVLAAARSGEEAVHAQLGRGAGTVTLGVVGTLVDAPLAKALARFAGTQGGQRLRVATYSSETLTELVREGVVTMALRYFSDRSTDLTCSEVGVESMVVVASGARPVPDDLARACWVGFTTSRLTRDVFGHLLRRRLDAAGIDDPPMMIVDSLSAQKRLIEAGFGLGLLPHTSVQDELAAGSLQHVDAPAIATEIPVTLVHRRGGYLSPAACALSDVLRAHAAKRFRPARRAPRKRTP